MTSTVAARLFKAPGFFFVALAMIAAGTHSHAADPLAVFDDGDFFSGWEYTQIAAGHGGNANFYTDPQTTEGYPGRLTYTGTDVAADCSVIYGFAIKLTATYDPSEDGAIGYISYSEDAITYGGFGSGQATGPALRQSGNMYIAIGLVTGTQETWHSLGQGRLGEKDFIHVTGGGCPGYVDDTQHPDFSKEGSTIEFGFFRANSQIDGQSEYGISGGLDNWHIALYPFHYVAMGDSYSAGEGLSPYFDGTDSQSPVNTCHRSSKAYGFQLEFPGATLQEDAFLACSGAKTYNLLPEPPGERQENAPQEPTQLDRKLPPPDDDVNVVNAGTDMVTLSIGGNDLGFVPILTLCAYDTGCDSDTYRPFQAFGDNRTLKQFVDTWTPGVGSRAAGTYAAIKAKAGSAAIFVLGYPKPFGGDCMGLVYEDSEKTWLNLIAEKLNRDLACKAKAEGVHMIQVAPSFAGHEVCSSAPWINGISLQLRWNDFVHSRSFHPTAEGQKAYARAVDTYLSDWVAQQKPLTGGGVPQNPAPTVPPNCVSQMQARMPATGTPSLDLLSVSPAGTPICDGRGTYVAGQQIHVTGSKFGPSTLITFRLESGLYSADFATATSDNAGAFDAVVTIPAGSPTNGTARLSARGLGAAAEPRLLIRNVGLSTSFAADEDGDGVPDPCDLCPGLNAPGNVDSDGDDIGDACDPCPNDSDNDVDADGLCANVDPCPWDVANDADSDGHCETDDNCPVVANADQLDSDRDGVGNACDGAPFDPGVIAAPVEVGGLVFDSDGQTLTWTSAIPAAGALTVHDVTRGTLGSFPVGNPGSCVGSGVSDASATDAEVPSPGQGFWYLVRARNALGIGTYGYQSGGAERITNACPFE